MKAIRLLIFAACLPASAHSHGVIADAPIHHEHEGMTTPSEMHAPETGAVEHVGRGDLIERMTPNPKGHDT
jgi:hypothetical protein